jgi:sulfur-oxidizing protein SoxY
MIWHMMNRRNGQDTTRREVLRAAGMLAVGCGLAPVVLARPAAATPAAMQAAIAKVVGEAQVKVGKVTVDIPPLVENGNTVPCTVTVDSPMTPQAYVKAIHVFNEKNPQPNAISVHLGPRAGRADISTRIRLADSQTVTAIAELSDGSFWSGSVDVHITLGACLEDARI